MNGLYLDLNDSRQRALARLIIAYRDITSAAEAAKYICNDIKSDHDKLFAPLCNAVVINYSRPFIRTIFYPGLPKKYCQFTDAGMQSDHAVLIEYRNAFVAHSDLQERRVGILPKGSHVKIGDSRGTLSNYGHFVDGKILPHTCFPRILTLCQFQLNRINTAMQGEMEHTFKTA